MRRTGGNVLWAVLFVAAMSIACTIGYAQDSAWSRETPSTSPAAQQARMAGQVEAVTIYRGQALVTRLLDVALPAGATELIVTDLPTQVIADSLYANTDGAAQVRAVRYRVQALSQEPREEVRAIDQQMQDVQKAVRKIQSAQALLAQKAAYIDNLEKFTAEKTKDDLNKGTLNAEAVKTLTDLVFKTRTEISDQALVHAEEIKAAQEKLDLLQRQRGEIAARFTRTAREAVIFLDKQAAGRVAVRLNYLVQGAGWSPIYNLRATSAVNDVSLEYNALVNQMSGESWDNVKLTLSTASSAMAADAPILTPLWLTLNGGGVPGGDVASIIAGQKKAAEELGRAVERQNARASTQPAANLDESWNVSASASKLQIMDFIGGKDVLMSQRDLFSADSGLSVTYTISGAISVPSRSDQQMIQIAGLKLTGDFFRLATPLLSTNVYEQAEIVNTTDVALLSGKVNSYMDGQFMGTGQIPVVAKGQRFTVGFGVDSQLRAMRELADKTDRVQGGNREMVFTYRLLIDNYKDKPVKVRVLDRMVDPKNPDIRVTLVKTTTEVSADEVYQRTINKMGILRWEVEVPAKAAGARSKTIEYTYKIEFDKNARIGEPSPAEVEKGKAEFKDMLEQMKR